MTEFTVPTLHGRLLDLYTKLGYVYTPDPLVSLNAFFDSNTEIPVSVSDKHKLKFLAIGNGGHSTSTDSSGNVIPAPVFHSPVHAGLYNQIPFVLRLANDDITGAEQGKYRMRVPVTIDAVDYIAYYLKVINLPLNPGDGNLTVTSNHIEVSTSGVISTVPHTPSTNALAPDPPDLIINTPTDTTNKYVSTYTQIPLHITSAEITDIIAAITILTGSGDTAVISEMALCTGTEHFLYPAGVSNGYAEVTSCQVSSFLNTFFMLQLVTVGEDITITANLGQTEPLTL